MPKKGIMACPKCNYKSKEAPKVIKETVEKTQEIGIVEKETEAYPLVDKECPKCGHNKAYFWEVQTRASDEPATQFFKCEKCKHTWRHYD
jgi:DNA-directed RNA polymerase subunit M